MNCKDAREQLFDLAAPGAGKAQDAAARHVAECAACAAELNSLRQTMALLDEWRAPEPSPYFDVRLQARLREEIAKPQAGWLAWFRRPLLAAALTVLMGIGVGLFFTKNSVYKPNSNTIAVVEPQMPA